MGKRVKLPFFVSKNNNTNTQAAKSLWSWPSCHQPRTLSFRTNNQKSNNDMLKTMNSAYLHQNDTSNVDYIIDTTESWFTNSSESASFSTASDESGGGECIETVIKGLRSERLFFEPGETSSILEEAKTTSGLFAFKESVVLSMDSQDPYVDFRESMEEMVEAHGLKDWEGLEELLCWYLRANGKSNHGYIVGAFVDLLVGIAFANTCSSITSSIDDYSPSCSCSNHDTPSSPFSFYTSSSSSSSSSDSSVTTTPCVSSLETVATVVEIENCSPCTSLSSLLEDKQEICKEDEDEKDDASC